MHYILTQKLSKIRHFVIICKFLRHKYNKMLRTYVFKNEKMKD